MRELNHDWWVRFQDFEVLEAFHLFNHHGNPRVSDFDVHTIRLTAVLRRPYKLHYETSQSGVFLSKIAENLLRVHFKSRVHLTNILFIAISFFMESTQYISFEIIFSALID